MEDIIVKLKDIISVPQFPVMKLRTLDLASGTWYVCLSGHKYCVPYDEDANLENKCPECGLKMEE